MTTQSCRLRILLLGATLPLLTPGKSLVAQGTDFGDAPASYLTTSASNGASHTDYKLVAGTHR